jgi:hypothetical protein
MFAWGPGRWDVVGNHSRADVPAGSIKSYPCTQKNLDRTIDSLSKIRASWDANQLTVGEWDWAFDIWVNGFGSRSTAEVMIWTHERYNGVIPPRNAAESDKVTIDGHAFTAWRRQSHVGGSYIALAMEKPTPVGRLDVLAVLDWLVGKGWLKGSDKVSAVEYGVEIANTAGAERTFRLNDFNLITE